MLNLVLRPLQVYGIRWAAFLATIVATAVTVHSQSIRYALNEGQKFSYDTEITVDGSTSKTTYKGITNYTVTQSATDIASLTYSGGLRESKVNKQPIGRGGRFGGFRGGFPGPPSIPSPFSRPTFSGKTQTTNKFTLSSRGTTLAMTGDSQLPYLLGNVSLMPFELLPEGNEKQWTSDSGISITEENENSRDRFGAFGPFGPFAGTEKKSKQAAVEVTKYAIVSEDGDLVKVKKTYQLITPKTPDNDALDMTGQGTWTFDRQDHVPHACDMQYALKVKSGNTTTTIPIHVKYSRLTQEQLDKIAADAKARMEEAARKADEAKALAERPLTPEEKTQTLADLASGDDVKIQAMLKQLATKTLKDPDPEIVAAIESHLTSKNSINAKSARSALAKWSPSYAAKARLNKDYQGPGPVKSTGLVVESITPLAVGQLVQAQRNRRGSFWFAGRIKELMPTGEVKIAFLTWGKENDRDLEVVQRRQIQLAPPELDQPDLVSNTAVAPQQATTMPPSTSQSKSRTWSDITGKFKVDAEFVEVTDGKVSLKRADGRTMSIPIDKLSAADQAHVKELEKAAENPFVLD
ncbi:MAG: hypothetical protein HKN47_28060 [Pirellulaceae bacterium]|nr:hypothetical protein [Pirellulaceae bacterium]